MAHTWYDSQSYDDETVTLNTLSSHLRYYFIPSNYKKRAKEALAAYLIGNRSVTKYINTFHKRLVCCVDVQE